MNNPQNTKNIPGEPLSIDDLRAILRREKTQKYLVVSTTVALVILIAVFVVATSIFANSVSRVQEVSDRTDCARKYSSLIQDKKDVVNFLDIQQNSILNQALFASSANGTRSTQETIDLFGKQQVELNKAVEVAKALPTPNEAANNGFTLDGVKYPPCIKVG